MDDETSRIYVYTFISKTNSKFFQQKFTLPRAAHTDANPQITLFKACHGLFMSSKNVFGSYLMIFKCALAIWLRSLTIETSDVPCTGENVTIPLQKVSIM